MTMRLHGHWRFILVLILSGLPVYISVGDSSQQPGVAFPTTVEGSVLKRQMATGEIGKVRLHKSFHPADHAIETDAHSRAALSLSNGVGLAIGPDSSIAIRKFQQTTHRGEIEAAKQEPADSDVIIVLTHGSLAISAERLSPLSSLVVETPLGTVTSNSSVAHLSYSENTLEMKSLEGQLSYIPSDTSTREFLHAPQKVTLERSSANASISIDRQSSKGFSKKVKQLADAARHSSQRVIFTFDGEEPQPALVFDLEKQIETARPYTFQK